jgi:mRNA interferase MazF
VKRGDVYDVELPSGSRPGVIVTRDVAIPVLANVTVALVTSRIREIPTEVPLGERNGLARDCVANCDNLQTIPKAALGRRRGSLAPEDLHRLRRALVIALELDR